METSAKEWSDILKLCRLCLSTTNSSIVRNIFSNDLRNWTEADISKQIYEASSVKVTINDGPTGICLQCLEEIAKIIEFQKRCSRTNDYLLTKRDNLTQKPICDNSTTVDSDQSQRFISFIDLGDEKSYVTTQDSSLQDNFAEFDDLTDYEVPSPDFVGCENDEEVIEEDGAAETSSHSEESNSESELKEAELLRCRYKFKGSRQPKRFAEPLPRLKKKDIFGTKAYRGLCHLCGKHFSHLWVHLQSHEQAPTDTCHICGKGFRSKVNLKTHMLLHQDGELPCDICGKKYRTKTRLKRHQRVHTNDRPFQCHICQKKFYTKYNVDVHMRMHTGDKPHACTFCVEKFTHGYALKQHIVKCHKQMQNS